MTSPSSILSRAADLIRDTAAEATPGPWTLVAFESDLINQADIKWIALMSPAVAPMIEKWLRDTASYFDEFADYWVTIPEQACDAVELAQVVLMSMQSGGAK